MSRLPALALGATAAVLAGSIALQLGDDFGAVETAAPARRQAVAAAVPADAVPPRGAEERWTAIILERPLFSPERRRPPPAPVAAAPAPVPAFVAPPPRLSGVLIGPHGRSAIFAGEEGGKAISIEEGGQIGTFVVQTIEAGQVTLHGPDGPRVLRPSFAEVAESDGTGDPQARPSAVANRRQGAGEWTAQGSRAGPTGGGAAAQGAQMTGIPARPGRQAESARGAATQ